MRNPPHAHPDAAPAPDDHAHRHAYNAAFDALGLAWHWDPATYDRLKVQGPNSVRSYLETEQPHLLRAYDADFLVDAVETAKARQFAAQPPWRAT